MSSDVLRSLFKEVVENETAPGINLESIETSYLDTTLSQREVSVCEEAIDSLENLVETFDGLYNCLKDSRGDLGPAGGSAIKIAVEGFYKQLGINGDIHVTVESLKDTLKKLWDAIKNAINKAFEAIGEFFRKLSDYSTKFKAWCRKKEKDLKEKSKEKIPLNEIDRGYLERISFQGKIDIQSIASGIDDLIGACKQIRGPYMNAVKRYYSEVVKIWKDPVIIENEREGEIHEAIVERREKASKILIDALQSLNQKELIANKKFVLADPENKTPHINKLSDMIPTESARSTGEKIKPPSTNDLIKLLLKSQELLAEHDEFSKALNQYHELKKGAFREGDKFTQSVTSGKLSEVWDDTLARSALQPVYKRVVDPLHQFSAHILTVSRGVQMLVEQAS